MREAADQPEEAQQFRIPKPSASEADRDSALEPATCDGIIHRAWFGDNPPSGTAPWYSRHCPCAIQITTLRTIPLAALQILAEIATKTYDCRTTECTCTGNHPRPWPKSLRCRENRWTPKQWCTGTAVHLATERRTSHRLALCHSTPWFVLAYLRFERCAGAGLLSVAR